MATATRRTAAKKTTASKPAPAPQAVDEDEELEELEADEVAEAVTPAKMPEVTYGIANLAKALSTTDKPVTTRALRTLTRKLAREGRINREITPGNRTRYDWSGPKDPEVQVIVKAYRAGELDAVKNEKLAELKQNKAAQKAEKDKLNTQATGKTTPAKRTKPAPAPVVESIEDDEELELDEE